VKFVREIVLPLDIEIQVAILIGSIGVQPEMIVAGIGRKEQIVFGVHFMTDVQIGVIERSATVTILLLRKVFQDPVGIGRAAGDQVGSPAAVDRALERKATRERAN